MVSYLSLIQTITITLTPLVPQVYPNSQQLITLIIKQKPVFLNKQTPVFPDIRRNSHFIYLKAKVIIREISVIDNGRIQALEMKKEPIIEVIRLIFTKSGMFHP